MPENLIISIRTFVEEALVEIPLEVDGRRQKPLRIPLSKLLENSRRDDPADWWKRT
jgi:hypothetical protein